MSLYTYRGVVTSVHDGDTFRVYLDLGFDFTYAYPKAKPVRVYGINAPELTTMVNGKKVLNQAGEDSTQHLMTLMGGAGLFASKRTAPVFGTPGDYLYIAPQPLYVVVESKINLAPTDFEKYGRILGRVTMGAVEGGLNLGAQMLADGAAVLDLPFPGAEMP